MTETYEDEILVVGRSGRRLESPGEIIEPGSTIIYEQDRGCTPEGWFGERRKIRERMENLVEGQDGEVLTLQQMRDDGAYPSDVDYDRAIMSTLCPHCTGEMQGSLIMVSNDESIYATTHEMYGERKEEFEEDLVKPAEKDLLILEPL